MVDSLSLEDVHALALAVASFLVVGAGTVLGLRTSHRILGVLIATGGVFSLLGDQQLISLVFDSGNPGTGLCELAGHCGWFIVGICSVLLAAQCTMPHQHHSRL